VPLGFHLRDSLHAGELRRSDLRRSLHSLGLRSGDVLTLTGANGGERHFELGGGEG
jgi:hypothetical protein